MPRSRQARVEPEDLVRLRFPSQPVISPDGRFVVFVEKQALPERDRYRQNLWILDMQNGTGRALTTGDHGDHTPCWTPDSRSVVFVSDRPRAKGRDGQANLWIVALNRKEPEPLTDLDGRVRSPRVSPDGRSIAFLYAPKSARQRSLDSKKPGPRIRHLVSLTYKHDGLGFEDDAWMHVWILDRKKGRPRQVTFGKYHDAQPAWSPDGRSLVFVSNRMERPDYNFMNSDLFVVPARGGTPRILTPELGPKQSPVFSPDGREVAYIGHSCFPDTVENMHVWVAPLGGGRPRDLMPDVDLMCDNMLVSDTRDVPEGEAAPPVWSADGKRLFFLASVEGASNIWEIQASGGAPRPRSKGQHEIAEFTQSPDGRHWAFVRITPTRPGDVYVATATGQTRQGSAMIPGTHVRRLTRLNEKILSGKKIVVPEELRIPCPGGHTVHGWLVRAEGRAVRRPAVLMVHGGPYAAYGWAFMHEFQMLASHGTHVFFTNIRGSVSYGRNFMRALVGKWGHADFEDLMQVTDSIEALPFVDRNRIALAGGSYGGYATNWTIGHTRRFKCAITMRSVVNLVSMFGSSDIGWDFVTEFDGNTPWESPDRYWRVSPLAYVQNIRTPLLIMHSDEDYRCPVSQAEELFTALKVLDRDVEMIRFLGDGHGLSRSGHPQNRVERLRRILDWFDRKL